MTTYPLPTLAATVSAHGITAPDLNNILSSLIASYQGIYGADVYLGPDTQDGQWLGIIADAINDSNQTAIAVYNQFSPATAVGTGLSSVVKINGIARYVPSSSTDVVTIVGQVGTLINNGLIGDNQNLGTQWALPASVTIPESGTIDVTATCTIPGHSTAAPGTLIVILTPTPGWQTVTNSYSATPGAPVEDDAQLRLRQSISTTIPALTVLESIVGNLENLAGVIRVKAYENDTGSTDSNGAPGHVVYFVVEGGDAMAICQTIADTLTPGVLTWGTVTEIVFDANGVPRMISYTPLTLITTSVAITAAALAGYVGSTGTLVKAAVATFLSELAIGEDSYLSRLYSPANLSGDAATSSSGLSQTQLDTLSATYDIEVPFGLAQARQDMTTTTSYSGGSSVLNITNVTNFSEGQMAYVTLSDGLLYQVTITLISGNNITISPAIGGSDSVNTGALVYVVGNIDFQYDEAASAVASNVQFLIS